jgi:hypothetical protein
MTTPLQSISASPRQDAVAATPHCPQCRSPMTLRQLLPVMFSDGADVVIYGCNDCGAELERIVERG